MFKENIAQSKKRKKTTHKNVYCVKAAGVSQFIHMPSVCWWRVMAFAVVTFRLQRSRLSLTL